MKHSRIIFGVCLGLFFMSGIAFGQSTGDLRSHATGDWSNSNTWERYESSTWVSPASSLPDTLHVTTIRNGHTVTMSDSGYIGNSTVEAGAELIVNNPAHFLRIINGTLTVNGLLVQTGHAARTSPYSVNIGNNGGLVVGSTGTFQSDQDSTHIPRATWNDGSTLLVTGTVAGTGIGSNPGQSYYNIVYNCPNQTGKCNLSMHPDTTSGIWDTTTTIRGDLTILNSGTQGDNCRVYFAGPDAGNASRHNVSRIIVQGNINVLNGSVLSAEGTS
jgi:hypothetical protein